MCIGNISFDHCKDKVFGSSVIESSSSLFIVTCTLNPLEKHSKIRGEGGNGISDLFNNWVYGVLCHHSIAL